MQYSGPPRSIIATHVHHCFAQANGGSTNLTQLGIMHYYYPLNITKYRVHIYFMVEDRDIYSFTLTGN